MRKAEIVVKQAELQGDVGTVTETMRELQPSLANSVTTFSVLTIVLT